MNETLKPCPNCGSADVGFSSGAMFHWWAVFCTKCFMHGPETKSDGERGDAAEMWNNLPRRAELSKPEPALSNVAMQPPRLSVEIQEGYEPSKPEPGDVRERVAQEIDKAICEYNDVPMSARWEQVGARWKAACRDKADRILALTPSPSALRGAFVEGFVWRVFIDGEPGCDNETRAEAEAARRYSAALHPEGDK